ncbi:MAG: acetylglutamate kinase [Nitrospirae bacterium]|nr:acetylglutamate kinase [Nitrospirota bacterium]
MQNLIGKAQTLIDALPYIRTFFGKTVVIKYGGHAMVDEALKEGFALDVILLKFVGVNPIVVHGGGPQIGRVMERMGKRPEFVSGVRVTDRETMDIVEMVLGGKVNKEIVTLFNRHGGRAVGLTGKDGGLIQARKLTLKQRGQQGAKEEVDLGQVGDVEAVDPQILRTLEASRFIPVIAPVGVGRQGETYNINADKVAGHLAAALRAEKLVLLTDVSGVLDTNKQILPTLTRAQAKRLIAKKVIQGGMIPKVEACFTALAGGVGKTHIIDGRIPHALLLEIFTREGIGTEIVA